MYHPEAGDQAINAATLSTGEPLCPVCQVPMVIMSHRRGETSWKCVNENIGEDGYLICPLIEGRYDRRSGRLWNIKYETRPIL